MPETSMQTKNKPSQKASHFSAKYYDDNKLEGTRCKQNGITKKQHEAPISPGARENALGLSMPQIKSRERVRDLAEVFTNEREVKDMLDLVQFKRPFDIVSYRYLEPSCGNGNFLLEILCRKLEQINFRCKGKSPRDYELLVAKAVSSIYGIEICPQNVQEAVARLSTCVKGNFDLHYGSYIYSDGFIEAIQHILESNLIVGDAVNRPELIEFTEFKFKGGLVSRQIFNFQDLISQKKPQPIRELKPVHFLFLSPAIQKRQLELEL